MGNSPHMYVILKLGYNLLVWLKLELHPQVGVDPAILPTSFSCPVTRHGWKPKDIHVCLGYIAPKKKYAVYATIKICGLKPYASPVLR